MQQIFAYFHLLLVFFAEHLVDLFDLKPCLFDGEIDIAKILDRNAEGRNQADSRYKLAGRNCSRGKARDADANNQNRGNRIDDAGQRFIKIEAYLRPYGRFIERIVLLLESVDPVANSPEGFKKRKVVDQVEEDTRKPFFTFPNVVGIALAHFAYRLRYDHGKSIDKRSGKRINDIDRAKFHGCQQTRG